MNSPEMTFTEHPLAVSIIMDPRQAVVLRSHYATIEMQLNDVRQFPMVAAHDKKSVLDGIQALFRDDGMGSTIGVNLHLAVYKPFAELREGFTKTVSIEGNEYPAFVMLSELDPNSPQAADWHRLSSTPNRERVF